ncbi:MAG: alpha/beta hydrolase [Verrucomicrobiae bacterium]|nr:alpha/beta hydrolase [Verrucomicrobiae bacterium]NNJ42393.1 alpha/beta hydrolase [Akkermansiaceae bacterium]
MKHPRALFIFSIIISSSSVTSLCAKEVPLWESAAPGSKGQMPRDIPTLTHFPAPEKNNTGAALVICPGGGYGGLAAHEGKGYAEFLQMHGINAFVLKYRLGSAGYRHPVMLGDAARALRTVRANAEAWKIDPHKIGIMGSSAGGHLASTLLTHFDAGDATSKDPIERVSSRPDLGILCYAVISMGPLTHRGSKRNLLGADPSAELIKLLSNELQVTSETPPTFLWHTASDSSVKVENSLAFAAALSKAKVPFALHVYEKGRHGIGLAARAPYKNAHPWAADLLYWLKERQFLVQSK